MRACSSLSLAAALFLTSARLAAGEQYGSEQFFGLPIPSDQVDGLLTEPSTLRLDAANTVGSSGACSLAAIFDPRSPFATLEDFEIVVDPEDPRMNLVFTSNVDHGREGGSDIYVMRLDGRTGMLSGSPRMIASNYTGTPWANGPEMVYTPELDMGLLFAGPEGVHAAWRIPGASWDAFDMDLDGLAFVPLAPPALPGTIAGRTPDGSLDFGLASYADKGRRCEEHCYGQFTDAVRTDLALVLSGEFGLQLLISTGHPAESSFVLFNACDAESGRCHLFEAAIDGAGGLDAATLQRLTPVEQDLRYAPGRVLRGGVHPARGTVVVFAVQDTTLHVWEAEQPHEPFTSHQTLENLPQGVTHLRVVAGAEASYLHFLVRQGEARGSYAVRYGNRLSRLVKISARASGAEFVYLPAVDRFALYDSYWVVLPDGTEAQALGRCWIDGG